MDVAGLPAHHARYRPQRPAFGFDGIALDWRGVDEQISRLAGALRAGGIGRGDRVAAVLPNCPELLWLYWACARLGAVSVPLSPLLTATGLASLLGDAAPRQLLCCRRTLPAVEPAIATLAEPPRLLVTDLGDGSERDLRCRAAAPDVTDLPPPGADDPFNIIYSSGTTGMPKGIVHSHRVRAHYATLFANAWRMRPESVVLHTGSIVFNGAFVTMMPAFLLGCRYLLAPAFDAAAMLASIERERVTHTMMVPTQIAALLDHPAFDPGRLASLEMLLSLGAPLPAVHKRRLMQCLPGRLNELYGLTEGFVTILDRDDVARKPESVGVPPPFYRIRIEREDGSEAAAGEVGEIAGRGPIMMTGYYRRPDLTGQAVRNGWLYSGDLGYVDDDGFLHLMDRKKDMIVSGGVKVYPSDIEQVVVHHPDVLEAVVIGVPDRHWGEVPVGVARARTGSSPDAEAVRDWVNQRLAARYQCLRAVVIVDDLPRNVAGKVLRRELRQRYRNLADASDAG
ncbi:MAG: AMP-binding protein [Rhodocyclaceae bacterium]|nr:AMP-binding protein [Rhodocyclaceae bacterium]